MSNQNFKVQNNLQVLGTGNSSVAGSLSVTGSITGSLNGNATTANTTTSMQGGYCRTGINTKSIGGSEGSNAMQVIGDVNNPAMLSFHRENVHAINFGLDTDNVFRLGGWSDGLNTYRFTSDTAGNFTVRGTMTAGGGMTINNSAPMLILQDTDHRSAAVHVNNNRFYILRGAGINSASQSTFNGLWPLEFNLENNDAIFGGNVTVAGGGVTCSTLTEISTIKIKENIRPLLTGLDVILALRPVTYDLIDGTMFDQQGLIAEEVNVIASQYVTSEDDVIKGVQYGRLTVPLINSIKEHNSLIQELNTRILELESIVRGLQNNG